MFSDTVESEIPVVAEQEYVMPEDTSEFSVYQPTGSIQTFEETIEEPEPQFEVFQSSGNFTVDEPEETAVDEPQYEVFQSTGMVEEEEIEEIVPDFKTYGAVSEPENVEMTATEPENKSMVHNKFGDFEFDLDLPDFEPFEKK